MGEEKGKWSERAEQAMRSERSKQGEEWSEAEEPFRDEGAAYFRATNALGSERRDKALCAV